MNFEDSRPRPCAPVSWSSACGSRHRSLGPTSIKEWERGPNPLDQGLGSGWWIWMMDDMMDDGWYDGWWLFKKNRVIYNDHSRSPYTKHSWDDKKKIPWKFDGQTPATKPGSWLVVALSALLLTDNSTSLARAKHRAPLKGPSCQTWSGVKTGR